MCLFRDLGKVDSRCVEKFVVRNFGEMMNAGWKYVFRNFDEIVDKWEKYVLKNLSTNK